MRTFKWSSVSLFDTILEYTFRDCPHVRTVIREMAD